MDSERKLVFLNALVCYFHSSMNSKYLYCKQALQIFTSFLLSIDLVLNGLLFPTLSYGLLAHSFPISVHRTLVLNNDIRIIGNLEIHICCWRLHRFFIAFLQIHTRRKTFETTFFYFKDYWIICHVNYMYVWWFLFKKIHVSIWTSCNVERIFKLLL
jgi:hypothetical protein